MKGYLIYFLIAVKVFLTYSYEFEKAGIFSCDSSGCFDCYSWCPQMKEKCNTMLNTICKKTCNFCGSENQVCKDAKCDQECNLSSDGKTATCSCFNNFRLSSNGSCVDINECEEDPNICSNPAKPICTNQPGSYRCSKCEAKQGWISYYGKDECCRTIMEDKCGLSASNHGKIVSGESADVGAWPWQALLMIPGNYICGGTLISDQWVLTAAHCLQKGDPTQILLGVQNVTGSKSIHIQTFTTSTSVIYPGYKYPNDDIALVKLNKPITKSWLVQPACLPAGESTPVGTKCYATGYGALKWRGKASKDLQEVDLPIVDMKKCISSYSRVNVTIDPDKMICAGYDEGGKDACQGDSGGPLVCQRCDRCNWYVAGVVSFGKGCGKVEYYGVYTNVIEYEDWISKTISKPLVKKTCVKPEWSQWGQWSACSKTCQGGSRTRSRTCNKGAGTSNCYGPLVHKELCNTQPCFAWTEWTKEGECSELCDGGKQKFVRSCDSTQKTICTGPKERFEDCNTFPCATWSTFVFSPCSVTCGGGVKIGKRTCDVVEGSDKTCEGPDTIEERCNTELCDLPTTDWSACSVSCGGGFKTRTKFGVSEKQTCNLQPCPKWKEWSAWTECSKSCETGKRESKRVCLNGRPGDDGCTGPQIKTEECNTQSCPVWSEWGEFGPCSATCGEDGVQFSTRTCIGGKVGDVGCIGDETKIKVCNRKLCPVWSEWESTGCSVTCGEGSLIKTRKCINGNPGEDGCTGPESETLPCSAPVACSYWTQWSEFGPCSATCGTGIKVRTRDCTSKDLSKCPGPDKEEESCEVQPCDSSGSCALLKDNPSVKCYDYAVRFSFCESYKNYMQQNCAKSCCQYSNPVKPECVDEAGSSTCALYKSYCFFSSVSEKCKKTCRVC